MIRLVIALGNPGIQYEKTRHNIGWMVLDRFLMEMDVSWKQKFNGRYAQVPGRQVHCIKPLTYMNLSGKTASKAASFFSLSCSEILAIHDETERPFGTASFRVSGGTRGHKGLRSLAQELTSPDFLRLGIGIGRPRHGDVSSHVMGRFSREEEFSLPDILSGCARMVNFILDGNISPGDYPVIPDHQ